MATPMAFVLFGDQSADTHGVLADFCSRGPSLLSLHFLNEAGAALRHEIDQLPVLQRRHLPTFSTIQQLNQRYYESGQKDAALDSALLVTLQLANYIDHAENCPEDIASPEETCLIGLCTGLLPATAISLSPSLTKLIPLAVQMVLIAHRIGLHVSNLAEKIDSSSQTSKSWTWVIPGATEEAVAEILQRYNDSKGIAKTSRVYVSAVAPNSVAISGPPSVLRELFAANTFAGKQIALPVAGPYHAPHLHGSANIDELVGLDRAELATLLQNSTSRSKLISCSTGEVFSDVRPADIIRSAVRDILLNPLDLKRIFENSVTRASETKSSSCVIIPIGRTSAAKTLSTLLKSQTNLKVVLREITPAAHNHSASHAGDHGSTAPCKLAIVGMAGRFPDAATHEKLWELLEKGLDVHRIVPADRFDAKTHVDVSGKGQNKSHTPYGCWIENPGLFDPRFFNMSPREAYQTCPMQRMALSTCFEALEMSGYVPNRTRSTQLDRIGTFYGQTSDDWREINAAQDVDTYFITGGVRAFGPGRINYHFGFSGPSFSVDTACSSSMAALQLACTSLWAKDCDTAIVGGMSCMTNSDIFSGLSKGQFLSKTGPCATFDNDADGYCRADGVGTVIVKRLEDAIADKDTVLGVILGTATNHSADAISITHPHGETQEVLYNTILNMAGVDPLDVNYVEMHGTGTQAGDGTEMLSVTNVFAPASRKRNAKQPLYLGAVKANIGHGEAASGVTALIKCLMMLQKSTIPPHVGIKNTINKGFPKDLSERNVNIAFHKTPLVGRDGQPRTIYISNFSAAGGNSGLLLQDGPLLQDTSVDSRSTHVVSISAKSKSALLRNIEKLAAWLDQTADVKLADLAYTTTARRIQHNWRTTVTGSSLSQVKVDLALKLKASFTPIPPVAPKVAFLFTGQGSQYAALGKELYEQSVSFRDTIISYNDIAGMHGFSSFLSLINGCTEPQSLSPVIVQVGMVCIQMAMFQLWTSWGVKPSVVCGHSLGEYAALFAAGVMSASDTIFLAGTRAELLVRECTAGTHAMLAVKGDITIVTGVLAELPLNVACINAEKEVVVSGKADHMDRASSILNQEGLKSTLLKVPYAFHSAQVDPILDEFEAICGSVKFNKPTVPIASSLLGRMVNEDDHIDAAYLRDHTRRPVDFLGAISSAQAFAAVDEKTIWLELGPHPLCLGMVKSTMGLSTFGAPTLKRNESPYATISASLSTLYTCGIDIDWNEFHRDFLPALSLLDLPSYSFDDKNYWLQYTGDWNLSKGLVAQPSLVEAAASKPRLSTTTVQKIVDEKFDGDMAIITIETDIATPEMRTAILGHLVNGAGLCPSSIYGDMAMTVCDYAYKALRPNATESIGVDVAHMEVSKPLIANPTALSQLLRMEVKVDLSIHQATARFYSESPQANYAKCTINFADKTAWLSEWQRNSYLVQARIDYLNEAEKNGGASKIGRGLAYKLFAALVDYNPRYRGMEEVILGEGMEATSKVKFQTKPEDGNFFCSPYWIDSVAHISGFIVNGSDAVDSKTQVYISHGWESLRIAEPLSAKKTYRSYVKMQPTTGTMVAGDVFVFDGDRVVAMVSQLKFQCIPRKLLDTFLPPIGAAAPAKQNAIPAKSIPTTRMVIPKPAATAQMTLKNLQSVNRKLTSITSQVLVILAKEIGVDGDELVDNIAFTDLGVDSLMSLTVSGRMREELEIEVSSSMFTDHPTIGEFKRALAVFDSNSGADSESDSNSDDILEDETPELDDSSPISTPEDYSDSESGKGSLSDLIRATIAGEMGIDVDEIADHSDLTTMGMDSLMSLTILGSLREHTGMDLPADLFTVNATVLEIEAALNIGKPVKASPIVIVKPQKMDLQISRTATPERHATSVLLQGKSRSATKHLWIVPDGSGSATSYVEIPNLQPDLAVWGLNSPYMKTPEEFNNGVSGIAAQYIVEMKRRQPKGPYLLAGWSAGGVIAFESTVQLTNAGDEVEHLILLDTPCPLTIEPLPSSLHRWFASIGLLGDGDASKIPPWLLPHFASSVTALSNYTATKLEKSRTPKVTMIWCEDGVCKFPEDPRPDPYPYGHAQWLLENRTDFGPNLWDTYIDSSKIVAKHMPANHFSMMKGAEARMLGDLMREGLERTD